MSSRMLRTSAITEPTAKLLVKGRHHDEDARLSVGHASIVKNK